MFSRSFYMDIIYYSNIRIEYLYYLLVFFNLFVIMIHYIYYSTHLIILRFLYTNLILAQKIIVNCYGRA